MYFSNIILTDLIEYASAQGIKKKSLEKKLLDPSSNSPHISYETMVSAINYVGEVLDDKHLGLHIGEQTSLKVTAYVDSIMQYSSTLESAFENAIKYSKVISDSLECSLSKQNNQYLVRFEENPNWKTHQVNARKHILNLTIISTLKSLVAYTNRKYLPIKINFQYEKPKNLTEHYRLFNCSLNFNQPYTEIVFEQYIFDRSHKSTDIGFLENLKAKVEEELKTLSQEEGLITNLKKCILNSKPERISSKEAASQLNHSNRSLQRKLNELNTSFKKVEFEIQLRLAKTYLEEGEKSIDEISYLLGFSESSAFIRFFKTQTEVTPLEYRNFKST